MKPVSKPIKLETLFTTKHIETIQASIHASSVQAAPEKVAAEIKVVLAPAVEVRASVCEEGCRKRARKGVTTDGFAPMVTKLTV
jgi:hypothetical protein